MDLVLALAERVGVDLVLANDPDADRLAAAVPDRSGGWRTLSGNEIGALLADHLLGVTSGSRPGGGHVGGQLDAARPPGRRARRTLGADPDRLQVGSSVPASSDGSVRFTFGFEEALGYLVNDVVWDKDGLSAALVLAGLAADLHSRGLSVARPPRRPGSSATDCTPPAPGRCAAPMPSPCRRGDAGVTARHAGRGCRSRRSRTASTEAGLLTLRSEDAWLAVRPSGTEPKLKFYAEVVIPVTGGDVERSPGRRRGPVGRDRGWAALIEVRSKRRRSIVTHGAAHDVGRTVSRPPEMQRRGSRAPRATPTEP